MCVFSSMENVTTCTSIQANAHTSVAWFIFMCNISLIINDVDASKKVNPFIYFITCSFSLILCRYFDNCARNYSLNCAFLFMKKIWANRSAFICKGGFQRGYNINPFEKLIQWINSIRQCTYWHGLNCLK